jgi:hypothetical protein
MAAASGDCCPGRRPDGSCCLMAVSAFGGGAQGGGGLVAVTRVSGSGNFFLALITMLEERNSCRIG